MDSEFSATGLSEKRPDFLHKFPWPWDSSSQSLDQVSRAITTTPAANLLGTYMLFRHNLRVLSPILHF